MGKINGNQHRYNKNTERFEKTSLSHVDIQSLSNQNLIRKAVITFSFLPN